MTDEPLQRAIHHAVHEFESRWGNLDHTVDMTLWEDRTFQIEVYHTAGSLEPAPGLEVKRRLSTYRDVDGTIEHREYMWRPGSVQGDMYDPADWTEEPPRDVD